jgi:hypothetical protein
MQSSKKEAWGNFISSRTFFKIQSNFNYKPVRKIDLKQDNFISLLTNYSTKQLTRQDVGDKFPTAFIFILAGCVSYSSTTLIVTRNYIISKPCKSLRDFYLWSLCICDVIMKCRLHLVVLSSTVQLYESIQSYIPVVSLFIVTAVWT